MWKDFKGFLIKQNAIGLAVAVVIGVALNDVVKAIVSDAIMPIVAVAQPSGEWATYVLHLWKFQFPLGHLVNAVINFFIIGFVAWRISKIFVKEPPKGAPTTKVCQFCKSTIDIAATRCAHCTSQLSGA
jgi:large conductance mechanosensitive channel